MAEAFLGEIRIMPFDYPPRGWAFCNGQKMPISQNTALFSLLGTYYGGDGRSFFALPDLQGRVPVHVGPGFALGQHQGEAMHRLTVAEMPGHLHALSGSSDAGNSNTPNGTLLAQDTANSYSATIQNPTLLNGGTVATVGASQPHLNMQPFLTLSFCLALNGIYPSRN